MVMDGSAIHRGLYRIVAPAGRLRNGQAPGSPSGEERCLRPAAAESIKAGTVMLTEVPLFSGHLLRTQGVRMRRQSLHRTGGYARLRIASSCATNSFFLESGVRSPIMSAAPVRACRPQGGEGCPANAERRKQQTTKQRRRIRPPAQGHSATRHRAPSCIFALQPPKGHPEGAATSIAPDRTPPRGYLNGRRRKPFGPEPTGAAPRPDELTNGDMGA